MPSVEKEKEQHRMIEEGTTKWIVVNLQRVPEEANFDKYTGVEIACSNMNYQESCFGLLRRTNGE